MIAMHHPFRPTDAPEPQRGFALLLVIWVLALLALLAAGVAADTSSETVIARNRLDIASARDAAESGVSLAILGLLDPDPTKRRPADGSLENFQFGNTIVAVSIADEGGKIDLNTAPANLIGGLADELGIDASDRDALLAGIASRRTSLAKIADSAAMSLPFAGDIEGADPGGLGLQAFADASEILSLPGLSHDAATRLLPYLTVYSQLATINPLTAPREVLLAVPGIGPEEVDSFLNGRHQTGFEKPALSGVDRYVAVTPPRAITITARSRTGTASFTREAVVLISGNLSLRPYRILRWQQPRETPPSLAAAS
jgi:general secretion pathway protein K